MAIEEIINGKHPVLEVLRSEKRKCYKIWIAREKKDKIIDQIISYAKERKIPFEFISKQELSSFSCVENHQGIAAKVSNFQYVFLESFLKQKQEKDFLLILDGIVDPHNLGSLIRTAYLFGIKAVILPKDNSAYITSTVCKTSAGATEYLPIIQVVNIVSCIKELKNHNYWIAGAKGNSSNDLYSFDFSKENYALVLGSEEKGIRQLVEKNCDFLLSIPMHGQLDSLNVSVAGAVFMSEMARQRHFRVI